MSFRAQQTQFAAGHGGFHVGRLETESNELAWSYDCGTWGKRDLIDSEVAEACARHTRWRGSKPVLDVAYISHFHEDHVKGLPTLAASFDVHRVVAPLLEPWERLAQVVQHPNPSAFTRRLASDPETTLAQIATTVVLVQPGGDPLPPPPEASVPDAEDDSLVSPTTGAGTHRLVGSDATFTIQSGGKPIWILAPYVPEQLTRQRPDFIAELQTKWGGVSRDEVESQLADPQRFLKLVDTRDERTKLREAYLVALEKAGMPDDQNWTSLLL